MSPSHIFNRLSLYSVFALLALSQISCRVGPDYSRPNANVPADYKSQAAREPSTTQSSSVSTDAQPIAQWWKTLNDPELNALINRSIQGNIDFQETAFRVGESRAELNLAGSNNLPKVDGMGTFARIDTGKNASLGGNNGSIAATIWQAGLDASWEIDVFGGQRRRIEAAAADYQAAVEDRRAALVSLTAEVAHDYLELRGLQARLGIARDNLALQKDSLELTRSLQKAGFNSSLDVTRAQTQVSQTMAQIIPLTTRFAQQRHALATLLGEEPNSLDDELATPEPLPPLPATVSIGLPTDLLRRRPDIRRAERRIAAENARIGAAVSNYYPRFSITGDFGFDSNKFKHIFDWESRYFVVYPSVDWHILDFGRTKAAVDEETQRRAEMLLEYHGSILTALREVEDALVAYSNEQEHHADLAAAVDSARESVDIARDQYKQGIIDFLQVLDAQRQLLGAQDELAQSDQALSTNLVALYKAIGGGWEPGPASR